MSRKPGQAVPLSDAERQRRRRQRLASKQAASEFDPRPYLAEAVRQLIFEGKFLKEDVDQLVKLAVEASAVAGVASDPIKRKYIERQCYSFLNL